MVMAIPLEWECNSSMPVFIVTVSKITPCHGSEVSVKAFSSRSKAESWIDDQIAALVVKHGLDRSMAVDGWFVELVRDQTVQYDVVEEIVQ